jgi:hypothetical protein
MGPDVRSLAATWVFFTSLVPAETARRLGTGLLREAMTLRGRMNLAIKRAPGYTSLGFPDPANTLTPTHQR